MILKRFALKGLYVLLHPNRPLRARDFAMLRDGEKRERLNYLNRRVAEFRQAGKWDPLKRMRNKRRNIAENFDRLTAKNIADMSENCLIAIGYPKGIKYQNYRGNGKARLRRLMTGWAYGRAITDLAEGKVRDICQQDSKMLARIR
jgi:hypothetical protein